MCPCCCCYLRAGRWDVCTELSRSVKRGCVWQLPQFLLPGKESRVNRISHPEWVKLYVELNYAPNQNTKIPSATYVSNVSIWINEFILSFLSFMLGHICVFLSMILECMQCIKCSYLCKWVYLVFPFIYVGTYLCILVNDSWMHAMY